MTRDLSKVALETTVKFVERKRELEKKNKNRNLVKQVTEETMNFIDRIRELQDRPRPVRPRLTEEDGSSTLIVAGRCKSGVVVVADRRTMRGTEYREEKKIYDFYNVVTAFAGLTGLKDKFLDMVEGVLMGTRAMNISEAIVAVEDTMAAISERYKDRLRGESRIEALLSGLEHLSAGKAKLYHIFGERYAEEVGFLCIGHGGPYATCLAHGLYQPNLSMQGMAEIGIFLVGWVENIDSSVAGMPDVVFVEDDKGIRNMEKAEIEQVYNNTFDVKCL